MQCFRDRKEFSLSPSSFHAIPCFYVIPAHIHFFSLDDASTSKLALLPTHHSHKQGNNRVERSTEQRQATHTFIY
eukprot:scaffold2582_cov106-Skeletonema_dohrnii-CCMP3373.AAC.5